MSGYAYKALSHMYYSDVPALTAFLASICACLVSVIALLILLALSIE